MAMKKITELIQQNRDVTSIVVLTVLTLALPIVTMQFSDQVKWTVFDFVVATVLLLSFGLTYVFIARKLTTMKGKVIFGAAIGFVFLLVWAELAVGLIGTPFAGS